MSAPRSRAVTSQNRGYKSPNTPAAFSSCVMFQGIYSRTVGSFFSTVASSTPRTGMTAKQTVEEAVSGHKIVIFSKSYCPYCRRAKNLISTDFANLKDQIYVQEYVPPLIRGFSGNSSQHLGLMNPLTAATSRPIFSRRPGSRPSPTSSSTRST